MAKIRDLITRQRSVAVKSSNIAVEANSRRAGCGQISRAPSRSCMNFTEVPQLYFLGLAIRKHINNPPPPSACHFPVQHPATRKLSCSKPVAFFSNYIGIIGVITHAVYETPQSGADGLIEICSFMAKTSSSRTTSITARRSRNQTLS
jgi:hypothetical protein